MKSRHALEPADKTGYSGGCGGGSGGYGGGGGYGGSGGSGGFVGGYRVGGYRDEEARQSSEPLNTTRTSSTGYSGSSQSCKSLISSSDVLQAIVDGMNKVTVVEQTQCCATDDRGNRAVLAKHDETVYDRAGRVEERIELEAGCADDGSSYAQYGRYKCVGRTGSLRETSLVTAAKEESKQAMVADHSRSLYDDDGYVEQRSTVGAKYSKDPYGSTGTYEKYDRYEYGDRTGSSLATSALEHKYIATDAEKAQAVVAEHSRTANDEDGYVGERSAVSAGYAKNEYGSTGGYSQYDRYEYGDRTGSSREASALEHKYVLEDEESAQAVMAEHSRTAYDEDGYVGERSAVDAAHAEDKYGSTSGYAQHDRYEYGSMPGGLGEASALHDQYAPVEEENVDDEEERFYLELAREVEEESQEEGYGDNEYAQEEVVSDEQPEETSVDNDHDDDDDAGQENDDDCDNDVNDYVDDDYDYGNDDCDYGDDDYGDDDYDYGDDDY